VDLGQIEWEVMNWIPLARYVGLVAVSCEHGNETSGSMKGGYFLDWLSEY